ncbi:maf-like protein [Carex littledalei]|uniref:Maf-like protein n=1 Tax=Carex littledalei TaxID=544730 RepID=A0A833R8D5_9POAL|nr:maf-like protein [Carex littledalei]
MGYQFKFTVMGADIDEKQIRREKAEDLVMALAEAKADAIIAKLKENGFEEATSEPTLLIMADQVVLHGGEIREKPSDADEARQFIKGCYSKGHASTVGSAMVTNLKTAVRKGDWDKAEVTYNKILQYQLFLPMEEGDVLYVAGGLMVEHPLTSPFVEVMVGTIDSVMGLSKALTERLIQEAIQEL